MYWEYDTRNTTRWNPDPDGLPFWSPYAVNYGMPIKFSDPDGDCPWVLAGIVAGMLLSTQTAVAPTGNWKEDGPRIRESNEDQAIGLLTAGAGPAVGRVVSKYLLKPIINKSAPVIKKVIEKVVVKKTTDKATGVAEKKLVEKFGQQPEKQLVKKTVSLSDDSFVHITPTKYADNILQNGLDPMYSRGKSYVTRWANVKNVTNPRDFNTILYRQNLWKSTVGKFDDGATILHIDAKPTFFSPRTNWSNGVPQYIFTSPVSPKNITPVTSF